MEVPCRLRRAIVCNDLSLTRRILANNPSYLQNPDLNTNGNTSLHLAALYGHNSIAEYLISLGHDATSLPSSRPSSRDSDSTDSQEQLPHSELLSLSTSSLGISHNTHNSTPLHLAAANGHTRTIQLLCHHFPQTVNRCDSDGATPLMLAARGHSAAASPHPSFLQSSNGPSSTTTTTPSSTTTTSSMSTITSSFSADPTSDTTPLTALLSSAASVHARDHAGNTCLHYASAWGNLKALRLLIQAGADPTAENRGKWTPQSYSLTVQADVYYKGLVLEWERLQRGEWEREQEVKAGRAVMERKGEDHRAGRAGLSSMAAAGAFKGAGGGGGVRLVTRHDDPEDEDERDESGSGRPKSSSGGVTISGRGRGQSDGMGELGLSLGRVDTWK